MQARNKHGDNPLRQALDLDDAGRLAETSGRCQEILEAVPDHTGALYLLAVIAHETGQPTQEVELIRRVLWLSSQIRRSATRSWGVT